MAEGSVRLYVDVPLPVTQCDVRAKCHLRYSLSAHLFLIGDVVFVAAVGLLHQSVAMAQIEHAQLLAHDLHRDVASSMESRSREGCNATLVGCGEIGSVVFAVERHQFVALESHVHVDAQVNVARAQGRDSESNLQSAAFHLSEVSQQLVIGEWWHRHVVHIEHVHGFGLVVVDGEHHSLVPESRVETQVDGFLHFPFQVGVGVADDAQCGR